MKEFRQFILRGNVIDLAIAVVLGTAFAAVIAALVADLVTPLIAAIGGNPDFGGLSFTINNSHFLYGHFLNALITFVVVAAVLFFLVVKPVNALMNSAAPSRRSRRRRASARSASARSRSARGAAPSAPRRSEQPDMRPA